MCVQPIFTEKPVKWYSITLHCCFFTKIHIPIEMLQSNVQCLKKIRFYADQVHCNSIVIINHKFLKRFFLSFGFSFDETERKRRRSSTQICFHINFHWFSLSLFGANCDVCTDGNFFTLPTFLGRMKRCGCSRLRLRIINWCELIWSKWDIYVLHTSSLWWRLNEN